MRSNKEIILHEKDKSISVLCSLFSVLISVFIYDAYPVSNRAMNILVYPFEYKGEKNHSWITSGLTDTVISDLNKIKGINVFSDSDRRNAIKEMELGMTGLFEESTVVKVGSIMGANIIFSGSIQVSGNNVRINAKLVNVETTKIEKSIKLDGSVEKIFALQDNVVLTLLGETEKVNITDVKPLKIENKDKEKIEKKYNPANEAYEWYCKGLEIKYKDPKNALGYFKKAIDISPDYTKALGSAGEISGYELSSFTDSLNYLGRAEIILNNRGEGGTIEFADLMLSTGIVYNAKREQDKALEYYSKSKIIRDNLGLQKTNGYSSLLISIGIAYDIKGDHDKALEFYIKSQQIKDDLRLQNTAGYSILMMDIGIVYYSKYQYDKALEYYGKSQSISDSLKLQNTADYAALLMNTGIVYVRKKDHDKALEYYIKSKNIRDNLGLYNNYAYANLINNTAWLYKAKGDKKKSGEHFRKAYELYKSLGRTSKAEEARKEAEALGY